MPVISPVIGKWPKFDYRGISWAFSMHEIHSVLDQLMYHGKYTTARKLPRALNIRRSEVVNLQDSLFKLIELNI